MPVTPRVPEWARWSGIPEPRENEGFSEYTRRLGLDPDPLLAGLNDRTIELANMRLASELMRRSPDCFLRYVDARKSTYLREE